MIFIGIVNLVPNDLQLYWALYKHGYTTCVDDIIYTIYKGDGLTKAKGERECERERARERVRERER